MFIGERWYARAGGRTRNHAMAFLKTRNTAEHDRNQSMETEPVEEIREFVRRDVVSNPGHQPETTYSSQPLSV